MFANDTFETDYNECDFSDDIKKDLRMESGDLEADSVLKRSFGLRIPLDLDKVSSAELQRSIGSPLMSPRGYRGDPLDKDLKVVKERIEASARNYRGAAKGNLLADRFGQFKFCE